MKSAQTAQCPSARLAIQRLSARCAAVRFLLVIPALALAACGNGGSPTGALTLPLLDGGDTDSAALAKAGKPVGSATEVYARLARGANACWFGANGPLKSGYVYFAEADAPSRGGKSLITLHIRDNTQRNPRGAKAYRIAVDPVDETSAVMRTEHLRIQKEMAEALDQDADRWARGEQGCSGATTAVGWNPGGPAEPATKATSKKKPSSKTKR